MSVLVDRKKPAPYNGRSQNSAPTRSTAVSKGKREMQQEGDFNSVGSSEITTASVNRSGVAGAEERMNRKAVERVDSHVVELLSTVPQVVLYQYEESSNTWERTSIEGTLFIYSRDVSPSHGFVLLNRLSSDNLQEMVGAGSEYRVQGVFVLFKKHSEIYGLCFNDESTSASTGEYLQELSSRALPSDITTPNRVVDRRSHSVPHMRTQGPDSRAGGGMVNILELLESAGGSYLNQAFSDDTGSSGQESPLSEGAEGIVFTAQPLTTSQQHQQLQMASGNGKPSSLHGGHQKGSVQTVLRNTPKTIPKLVNMNATTIGQTKPRAQSTSHVNSLSMQYSSRVAGSVKQTPALTTNQHTPKQDTVKPPLRSATVPSHMASGVSHTRVSPHKKKPGRQAKHNHTTGPLEEVVPEQPLPRKLFSSESQRDGSSGVNLDNVCLQNLFSQSLPAPLERNSVGNVSLTGTLAPIKPMSLAEIEKQMSDEVPSPDKITPFSLIPSHSTPGSTTGILSSSAPEGERSKLLQPSAFSATPSTSTAATPSSVSATPSGLTLKSDQHHSSTSASVSVSVEPPTPGLTNGVFPNVPPLMHSAGMRAPPVTASTVQQITQTQSVVAESQGERGKNGRGSPMGKNGRGSPMGKDGRGSPMGKRGGGKGGKTSRGGSRSPGPERSRTTPSPQSGQDVGVTPSRSFSVPVHMNPLSVVAPPQQASQPHTLLSPQQFSNNTDTTVSETPSREQLAHASMLSRDHLKQTLIHLIQNDDEFFSHIYHTYISMAQQHQHQ